MSCNLLLNYFDFGPDLPDFLFCVVNRNVHCGWMKDWQALQGNLLPANAQAQLATACES